MVDTKRLCDYFARLVETDSPTFGERMMCDRLKKYLSALGIESSEDGAGGELNGNAGNLYAYLDGEAGLEPLLFSTHMDTVEPSRGKKAVSLPDGKIVSDGTTVLGADDLAGVAAILEALSVLRESALPHRPIELVFSVAEEDYCAGIRHFDLSRIRSRQAYVLDLSGPVGSAAYCAPTILSFRAEFRGRAAHAAFSPEEGIHAVKAAAAAITRIPCGRVGGSTVNIGTVSGGTVDNVVPESCTVTGEVRSFSDEDAAKQLGQIKTQLKTAAEEYGARLEVKTKLLCPACGVDEDHPVVRRFMSACTRAGIEGRLARTYGGSDNNYFALGGISGLVIAAGMNNCHGCAEYTSVSELTRAAQLVLALMLPGETKE